MSVRECTCVCSWVWTRLQLGREAMAIPNDLKTGSPATLKCRGEAKCQGAQRWWKFWGWDLKILESGNRHTHTQTHRWSDGLREGTGLVPPSYWWLKWKEWRKDELKDRENGKEIMRVESEHTLKDKKKQESNSTSVYPQLHPPFLHLWLKVPCGQERILFLSHVLFSYTCPFSFFINSTLVASLSFRALLNGPLFLVTDWWMRWRFEVKSHGEAGRAWSHVGQKMAGRKKEEGREGGRRKRRGYIQQGGYVKQWTSIKSARDWGWMRVAEECEGKSRLSVFAWAPQGVCIVVLNMQKGQQHASRK